MGEPALKAREIEGLRELISQVILEERDKLVPVSLLQDVEEVRRSPAGAVIRMEGKIDHLGEDLSNFQSRFDALIARVATKEDMAHLSGRMDGIEGRMGGIEGRMDSLEGRMDGIEERMATKEDVAHLSDRMDALEEQMATKEIMEARFAGIEDRFVGLDARFAGMEGRFVGVEALLAGIEKRLDTYDFWLKLFGGVLTALMVAQLVAAFVK